jgi:transcriptional regulator with XRE-family HTH domain
MPGESVKKRKTGARAVKRSGRHRLEPDPLAARIGQRVRALRTAEEFGFDAFVEETGLGRGYVSELERGLVIPTIGTLARVAKALDVTVADLVLGESDRERLFNELRRADPKLVRELREWLAKRLG